MIISELIKKLETIKNNNGDLQIKSLTDIGVISNPIIRVVDNTFYHKFLPKNVPKSYVLIEGENLS